MLYVVHAQVPTAVDTGSCTTCRSSTVRETQYDAMSKSSFQMHHDRLLLCTTVSRLASHGGLVLVDDTPGRTKFTLHSTPY